ncbi:hypothetical protein G6F65_023080 [Rhizopus arrhizus]|nr:hypothetical protein G6F65_023080 [Rhizopus arrhizus]
MRQDFMNGRGPKTIRVPKAYRKVMDLTHNECDPALAESETKASDMTVSPRKAAPGSLPREAKEEGGREDRIWLNESSSSQPLEQKYLPMGPTR